MPVPLMLRALPLSLLTLWHYAVLLPFLLVMAFLMGLASFLPLVGLIVPGTVAAFLIMAGLRCALAARGHMNPPSFGRLLKYSAVFAILGTIASTVIEWAVVAGALTFNWLGKGAFAVPAVTGLGGTLILVGSVFLAKAILGGLYAAAIAVPMTATAAASTLGAPEPGYLFGIGAGMFSLFAISTITVVTAQVYALFGEFLLLFIFSADLVSTYVNGEDLAQWDGDTLRLAEATLYLAWSSSWFYATAVLAWESVRERHIATHSAEREANRFSDSDLRALREARQRGR